MCNTRGEVRSCYYQCCHPQNTEMKTSELPCNFTSCKALHSRQCWRERGTLLSPRSVSYSCIASCHSCQTLCKHFLGVVIWCTLSRFCVYKDNSETRGICRTSGCRWHQGSGWEDLVMRQLKYLLCLTWYWLPVQNWPPAFIINHLRVTLQFPAVVIHIEQQQDVLIDVDPEIAALLASVA